MMALADVVCRDQHLPRKELDTINATAADNIARCVVTFNAWRLASYQPMQGIDSRMSSASTKKVGRNDPCPCGSGKKYKKCCGLNSANGVCYNCSPCIESLVRRRYAVARFELADADGAMLGELYAAVNCRRYSD